MLNPIPFTKDGVDTLLVCEHWKSFPPIEVFQVGEKPDPRALRQALKDDARYNFYQVWQRVCGIRAMNLEVCKDCSCARWLKDRGSEVPILISLKDGSEMAAVDVPHHDSLPRNRSNVETMHRRDGQIGSTRLAAWIQQRNNDDDG